MSGIKKAGITAVLLFFLAGSGYSTEYFKGGLGLCFSQGAGDLGAYLKKIGNDNRLWGVDFNGEVGSDFGTNLLVLGTGLDYCFVNDNDSVTHLTTTSLSSFCPYATLSLIIIRSKSVFITAGAGFAYTFNNVSYLNYSINQTQIMPLYKLSFFIDGGISVWGIDVTIKTGSMSVDPRKLGIYTEANPMRIDLSTFSIGGGVQWFVNIL